MKKVMSECITSMSRTLTGFGKGITECQITVLREHHRFNRLCLSVGQCLQSLDLFKLNYIQSMKMVVMNRRPSNFDLSLYGKLLRNHHPLSLKRGKQYVSFAELTVVIWHDLNLLDDLFPIMYPYRCSVNYLRFQSVKKQTLIIINMI